MIGYLKGVPFQLTPERALLDVGGVGYAVHISLTTYYALQGKAEGKTSGEPVGLFIHTHLREGELALFGFATEREQQLFELLIGVSGIGPRLARVVLSGLPPEELTAALAAEDADRLRSIPGVGKKTAERMVLELAERARDLGGEEGAAALTTGILESDLLSALVNLGYKRQQAEKAVASARRDSPAAEFAELLRKSLALLSRA